MNTIFMTFMFGAGMPILFPIALASFIIFYIVERLSLAYSAKSPPVFDDKLNRSVVTFLLVAPLIFCAFGYWMLTNVQLFSNHVIFRDSFNSHIKTGHKLPTLGALLNQAIPLFIGCLLLIGMLVGRRFFSNALLANGIGADMAKILNENTKTEKHSIYETLVEAQSR
jgi:hypothetical protein